MTDQWRSNGRPDVRGEAGASQIDAEIPPCVQNWLNTPDGREGWASYFLSQGYTLYLTDQPQRGRSPWLPGDGTLTNYNLTFIQNYFTTVQEAKLWPQASLHTQVRISVQSFTTA
jgi:hypothetical protein